MTEFSELLRQRAPGVSPLRAARMLQGLSQRELEQKADLPRTTISHAEAGRRTPDELQRRRIAAVLDTDAAELFPPWAA